MLVVLGAFYSPCWHNFSFLPFYNAIDYCLRMGDCAIDVPMDVNAGRVTRLYACNETATAAPLSQHTYHHARRMASITHTKALLFGHALALISIEIGAAFVTEARRLENCRPSCGVEMSFIHLWNSPRSYGIDMTTFQIIQEEFSRFVARSVRDI